MRAENEREAVLKLQKRYRMRRARRDLEWLRFKSA